MKIKRKLRQIQRQTNARVEAKKQSTYANLVQKHLSNSNNKKTNSHSMIQRAMFASLGLAFACLLAISICATFCLPLQIDIKYNKENETIEMCTIENYYTDYGDNIRINASNMSIVSVNRVFDSVSNTTLFYSIQLSHVNGFINGNLYLIVNEHYKFVGQQFGAQTTTTWNGVVTAYSSTCENIDEYKLFSCAGNLEFDKMKIFFDYEQIIIDDTIQPLAFLEDALILK